MKTCRNIRQSLSVFLNRIVLLWQQAFSHVYKEWHGYETEKSPIFTLEFYDSLEYPKPKSDECHFMNFHGTLCGRKQFKDSNMCFWHFRDVSKYEKDAMREYFGTECSLKEAIENEVLNKQSLRGAYLENAAIGGNFLKKARIYPELICVRLI